MFDKAYLDQLINDQVEENPELEYKASAGLQKDDKKVMEMTKDVSALANSNGGIIIYGIGEDQMNRHLPGKIDPLDRKLVSKEWIEQVLNAKIRPRIHGLKINVAVIDGDAVVYILEVPKGDTAHQAEDKRYYRWHNFMVEPLFDHEIRDIMGRQKDADVMLDFEITRLANYRQGSDGKQELNDKEPYFYLLDVYAVNSGRIYAKYVNVVLTLPKRCIKGNAYDLNNQGTEDIQINNTVRDLVEPDSGRYYQGHIAKPTQYGPARYEPILPGVRKKLKSILINEYSRDPENEFSWTLFADNAVPKTGTLEFSEIKR